MVVMAVVGFGILFAGIVSPQAATASTAALLIFVLPVAVAQPASAVGPRLVGWALAGATCIPACLLVWPTPWHDDLRRRLSATLSAVGCLAQAHARGQVRFRGPGAVGVGSCSAAARPVRGNPLPSHRRRGRSSGTGQVGGSGRVGRRQCHAAQRGGPGSSEPSTVRGRSRRGCRDATSVRVDHLRRQGPPVDDPALVERGAGIDPRAGPSDRQ